ncbi:soluble NSF attachment protein gamma isoform [Planoprotostelium fungivorum]|uniref:Gamma-soluble NSF attachment protein n=1 Tax=Planoprotostelium fungivorum TaxID=1890364 RepID=A0A2P6MP59_9EUKA|nr:soluble NSF attachment protein gamma isoform [Planoprotostelium fungivorum]
MKGSENARMEEGNGYLKEADKLWKPDWDNACPLYEKAAVCFKNAKAYDRAKYAYKRAAETYHGMKLYGFQLKRMKLIPSRSGGAAKSLEEAAKMATLEKSLTEAVELYKEASSLQRENGAHDRAAEILIVAAKAIEETDDGGDIAIQLAKDAIDIYETEDRFLYAGTAFKYAVSVSLMNKQIDEAISILEKQAESNIKLNRDPDLFKTHLSLIVIHLHRDDTVSANKVYQEAIQNAGFDRSAEGQAAGALIDAFESGDQKQVKAITSKQVFTFLDNQVAKLAIHMKASAVSKGGDDDLI